MWLRWKVLCHFTINTKGPHIEQIKEHAAAQEENALFVVH